MTLAELETLSAFDESVRDLSNVFQSIAKRADEWCEEIDTAMSSEQFEVARETRANAISDLQCQRSKADVAWARLIQHANETKIIRP